MKSRGNSSLAAIGKKRTHTIRLISKSLISKTFKAETSATNLNQLVMMYYMIVLGFLIGFLLGRWSRGVEAKADHQKFLNELYDQINKLEEHKDEQEKET